MSGEQTEESVKDEEENDEGMIWSMVYIKSSWSKANLGGLICGFVNRQGITYTEIVAMQTETALLKKENKRGEEPGAKSSHTAPQTKKIPSEFAGVEERREKFGQDEHEVSVTHH